MSQTFIPQLSLLFPLYIVFLPHSSCSAFTCGSLFVIQFCVMGLCNASFGCSLKTSLTLVEMLSRPMLRKRESIFWIFDSSYCVLHLFLCLVLLIRVFLFLLKHVFLLVPLILGPFSFGHFICGFWISNCFKLMQFCLLINNLIVAVVYMAQLKVLTLALQLVTLFF